MYESSGAGGRICPHCGRRGCRSCAVRQVATSPHRDDARYWEHERHYPDHSSTGLYGNGKASEGPEDFGQCLWGVGAELAWEEEEPLSPEQARHLAQRQRADAMRKMVEHLATAPKVVRLLQVGLCRGSFTAGETKRVTAILDEVMECRRQLLIENSVLAAYVRSTLRESPS